MWIMFVREYVGYVSMWGSFLFLWSWRRINVCSQVDGSKRGISSSILYSIYNTRLETRLTSRLHHSGQIKQRNF